MARGRPDGDAARRPVAGEPRQPARGRQEREALVVRQPARTAAWSEKLQAHLYPPEHPYHHPTIGSMEDLDAASVEDVLGLLPDLLRAEQRGPVDRRRRRSGRRPGPGSSATSARSRPTRRSRRCGDTSLPPTLGGERREIVEDRVPLPRIYFGLPRPGARRRAARRARRGRPRSSPAARAAGSIAGSSATSGSPRTSSGSASGFVAGRLDLRRAGRPSGPASPIDRRRDGRSSRSSSGSGASRSPTTSSRGRRR